MVAYDVNSLFQRAERAFSEGRTDAARADLAGVLRTTGDHPAVLHLLALVESKAGQLDAAKALFIRALAKAPADPQINNNYANLCDATGDLATALTHYDRALAAQPGFAEARLNRATTRQKLGDLDAAIDDLTQLAAAGSTDPRVWEACGAVMRLTGDRVGSAAAFAHALALEPGRPVALHGAARIALEQGDDAAVPMYRRALEALPGDREVVLGLAEALEGAGEAGGVDLLVAATRREPTWVAGQDSLARMRSEAGGGDDFAAGYAEAIGRFPADQQLHFAHWRCLSRGGRHAEALAALDAALPVMRGDPALPLMEAVLASESGDLDRADAAFARAGDGGQQDLARGRHALRRGDPEHAAALIEPWARADLGLVTAWAHLDVAWRLVGDPRHQWLSRQPGLYAVRDLELLASEISALASVLRGLHRTRAHPIGQSLRGGTQTRGRLLDRPEPEIGLLYDRLEVAVAAHWAALPPKDISHPLLRHRDAVLRFDGSWSVRLTGGGFHVNHIHSEGVLSSACYIALPDETRGGDRAGWLEIGAPPAELKLDLPPLETIEPKPGRLVLFPSILFHGTRPFASGERLTVAFDMIA